LTLNLEQAISSPKPPEKLGCTDDHEPDCRVGSLQTRRLHPPLSILPKQIRTVRVAVMVSAPNDLSCATDEASVSSSTDRYPGCSDKGLDPPMYVAVTSQLHSKGTFPGRESGCRFLVLWLGGVFQIEMMSLLTLGCFELA
jgi:hypothetical protein